MILADVVVEQIVMWILETKDKCWIEQYNFVILRGKFNLYRTGDFFAKKPKSI